MQTLISVFDDRANARKAVDRLVQAGFAHDDVHLKEGAEAEVAKEAVADEAMNRDVGERTMHTAEREVAVDRGVLDALGHFFVSLFGEDRGEVTARKYGRSIRDGHSVVLVDAHDDHEAETAAVILHEQGAIDVDDHETNGTPAKPGVRAYERNAGPTLGDLAKQRQVREDSLLADRAGQVSKEMKQDREERAYASAMNHVDRDRPK